MVCAHAEGSREGRGTVEALRKARRRRTRFRRELSFERSRDVGRRVKKSPRGGEGFFTRWKGKGYGARRRGSGFASSWKSACVRNAFLVTDPSFPFFHPDWETLLAPSFGRSEEWIPSMKRFSCAMKKRNSIFWSTPCAIERCGGRAWRRSIPSLRVLFSRIFVEIVREEKVNI